MRIYHCFSEVELKFTVEKMEKKLSSSLSTISELFVFLAKFKIGGIPVSHELELCMSACTE